MRKLFISMLALLLVLMLPTAAFAATYNASSFADLQSAFAQGNSGTDVEIIINIEGDITWEDFLEAAAGKTFVLKGTGTNKLYLVGFSGNGSVSINEIGSVESAIIIGEQETDTVDVKINANVNGSVVAGGKTSTSISGDVSVDETSPIGPGIVTSEEATVTVTGNVQADNSVGIIAADDSSVVVDGNVTANGGVPAVAASDNAEVTVNGDVTATTKSELTEDEKNAGEQNEIGGSGVNASDNAKVTVSGNVTGANAHGANGSAGNGVTATDNAEVTVGGNATGGDVIADPNAAPDTNKDPAIAGAGIGMDSSAKVTVKGQVKGGNNSAQKGYAGDAIYLNIIADTEKGSVTVNGNAIGGTNTGADGTEANAIYTDPNLTYEYFNLTEFFKERGSTEVALNDAMGTALSYLATVAQELGLNDSQVQEFGNAVAKYITDKGYTQTALTPEQAVEVAAYAQKLFDETFTSLVNPGNFTDILVYLLEADGETFGLDKGYKMPQDVVNQMFAAGVGYSVKLPTVTGGAFTSDKASAKEGETVTLTAKPDNGYKVDFVKVNGEVIAGKNGVYTFVMPRGGAEITYAFKATIDATTQSGVPKTNDTNSAFLFVGIMALLAAGMVTMKKRIEVK